MMPCTHICVQERRDSYLNIEMHMMSMGKETMLNQERAGRKKGSSPERPNTVEYGNMHASDVELHGYYTTSTAQP
jgi:hypothetical protein